ncbi:DUF4276 family protein [Polyangium spumosum]|uniref:DUF4276 family protein n=1 Tax=Polyangium spumosum TaxID=889282 RepID=A0A6N7PXH2_9BACT|nr:DUF4276 family protein [Polyangium spumosum]MRG93511.1 DUF4276 family protein [Polyangium spumosum]
MSRARADGPKALSTIGLIVEGETEFHALAELPRLIPGCPPLKPTNLHGVGSHMTPTAIAKMVAPKVIGHIVAGRTRVVICIDRESRQDCTGQFAQTVHHELSKELCAKGYAHHEAYVVIADRTFEAWLLADARGLHQRRVFKTAPKFHSFEGNMGEQGRRGVLELTRLLGREYDKIRDGKDLFTKLNFPDARKCKPGQHGSRSLDKLLRTLGV